MSIDHLSGLPIELLVLICEQVDKEQLRHIRLSCKALDCAAFDRWADSFIRSKEWNLGDRNALPTLNSILATPHLARKMELVSLSIRERDFKDFQ